MHFLILLMVLHNFLEPRARFASKKNSDVRDGLFKTNHVERDPTVSLFCRADSRNFSPCQQLGSSTWKYYQFSE